MKLLFLTLSALFVCTRGVLAKWLPNTNLLRSDYNWKILDFNFPTTQAKQQALASGNLKPANAIIIDVQPTLTRGHRRTFVTIPRFEGGIPYTLATVSKQNGAHAPTLQPYPNYETHNDGTGANCDGITSAFRVVVNECNQMWVLDAGTVDLDAKCPPQLLLFDLNTDKIIHRYRFDESLYTPGASLFINLVVDVRSSRVEGNCERNMVYVADTNRPGLVVYDKINRNAWRIQHRFMYPDPDHGLLTVAGQSFVLMDGIFSVVTDKENLYFHSLASLTEYAVPLNVIDNRALIENSIEGINEKFTLLGRRRSPCTASAIDSHNNIYCVTLNPIKLLVWNIRTPYDRQNVIELPVSAEYLEFVSSIKVEKNIQGQEELWLLSSRFQKTATGTRDFDETNFNIVIIPFDNVQLYKHSFHDSPFSLPIHFQKFSRFYY